MSISDHVRKAILDCGTSRYRISKDLGISQALLSKFVNGKMGVSLSMLDELCEYLGLELRSKASRPAAAGGRRSPGKKGNR